jgi:hypothetical protein
MRVAIFRDAPKKRSMIITIKASTQRKTNQDPIVTKGNRRITEMASTILKPSKMATEAEDTTAERMRIK